jgi:dGTPase
MRGHGGFEHNLQSLRVVDRLEQRYADFDGLNLCFETREGILKHCSAHNARALEAAEPGGVGRRFLDGHQPSLEAQVANLADEIAYNVHDIDDGVRSGLLTESQLAGQVPLFDRCRAAALAQHPALSAPALAKRLLAETLRRMLSSQVHDLIEATAERLREAAPADVDGVRRHRPLVCFSEAMRAEVDALKRFLLHSLYRHPQVLRMTDAARRTVTELFDAYQQAPAELPPDHRERADPARAVADYVAGMTDRFAIREHRRLTGRMHFDGDPVQATGES